MLETILRDAQHIVVLTGAGISAESGIPTFRDALTGLWAQFSAEELASPQGFRRNPERVWAWYAARRAAVAQAQPNAGHQALVRLEQATPRFTLLTQNVDGLHRRAGSQHVIELHGNIERVRCSQDGTLHTDWDDAAGVPHCPQCQALLRPDVVWFGEALPTAALEAAWDAASHCDVFFSVGTAGLVEPAASLPHVAVQCGAVLVEVNPAETPLSAYATYTLRGAAGAVLPALVDRTWDGRDGERG